MPIVIPISFDVEGAVGSHVQVFDKITGVQGYHQFFVDPDTNKPMARVYSDLGVGTVGDES